MNIFEKYGLKEVTDVHFIAIEDDQARGVSQGDTVLFLDSLKLSNLSISAEEVKYYGGYGNSVITSWYYNKDVSLELQDALISMESLRLFFGGELQKASAITPVVQHRNKLVLRLSDLPSAPYTWVSARSGRKGRDNNAPTAMDLPVRVFWEAGETNPQKAMNVTIDAESFPGTYRIVGNGKTRRVNGRDVSVQFVIPKAKIGSGITIGLEADGEPAVFDLPIKAIARNNSELLHIVLYRDINWNELEFYVDVERGELVFRHPEIIITMFMDGEYLEFYDKTDPPQGEYIFEDEGDDLVFAELKEGNYV